MYLYTNPSMPVLKHVWIMCYMFMYIHIVTWTHTSVAICIHVYLSLYIFACNIIEHLYTYLHIYNICREREAEKEEDTAAFWWSGLARRLLRVGFGAAPHERVEDGRQVLARVPGPTGPGPGPHCPGSRVPLARVPGPTRPGSRVPGPTRPGSRVQPGAWEYGWARE